MYIDITQMYTCVYEGNGTNTDAEDTGKITDKARSRTQERTGGGA